MSLPVGLTLAALAGLLLAERSQSIAGRAVAKPIASSGFVATALAAGALESRYGIALLAALGLSWLGDLLLLSSATRFFLAGLVAFLFAHLAFGVAFALRGLDGPSVLLVLAVLLPLGGLVLYRLLPRLAPTLRIPVAAYTAAISLMVALGAGTAAASGRWGILVGALAFYLSDLAVALERFVRPGLLHRLWGLPLYYGAQLFLASSVA
jgi:uncharacterized membrane protein YhhN